MLSPNCREASRKVLSFFILQCRGWQNTAYEPSLACCLFLYGLRDKNVFYRQTFAIYLMTGTLILTPNSAVITEIIPFISLEDLYYKKLYSIMIITLYIHIYFLVTPHGSQHLRSLDQGPNLGPSAVEAQS